MKLHYQENSKALGVIKNEKNHELLGSLSDFGIEGSDTEMVKQLLASKDPRLDEVFVIQTSSEIPLSDDNPKLPKLNEVLVSRRELLLSQLIGRPYPTYVIDTLRNPNRDTYENNLHVPMGRETDFEFMYERSMKERREKAKENNPKLDKKRTMKYGYTFSSDKGYGEDHPLLAEGEIELSERELLEAGLDPDKLLEPEIETSKKSGLRVLADNISRHFSRDNKNR